MAPRSMSAAVAEGSTFTVCFTSHDGILTLYDSNVVGDFLLVRFHSLGFSSAKERPSFRLLSGPETTERFQPQYRI